MSGRRAWTVATYPHDLVRLACKRCERRGQYRRATLIRRFGADDASMPDVLQCMPAGDLRATLPTWRSLPKWP